MDEKREEEAERKWWAEFRAKAEAKYEMQRKALATPEQRQKFVEEQCKYLGIKPFPIPEPDEDKKDKP